MCLPVKITRRATVALVDPKQANLLKRKRGNKYGAKPLVLDGIRFNSRAEAARYIQLKDAEKAGKIWDLKVHPHWRFKNGKRYYADFKYDTMRPNIVGIMYCPKIAEDVKGGKATMTALAKFKIAQMMTEFGIDVEIVVMDSNVADTLIKAYVGANTR
jgi:hypothetical protein